MLTGTQRSRYDRHLRLAGFGAAAQERLLASGVLVVGAGGLGSPALLYLAAAGVGRIGIVDDDVVDRSNLHRQVIHHDADVGRPKVASAARAIRDINPEVVVETHELRLGADNALDLIRRYDLVLDGADNFTTRYLVNDAAYFARVPVVHGSVHRFEGQATVFAPPAGPCYRCLFPEPPPPGSVPACSAAGVLGVLPGMIGMVQATEAVKLLTGVGEPLIGRLLRYDAASMRWGELRLARDPTCALCGAEPSIRTLVESAATCAVTGIASLSVDEYARLRERGEQHLLLDVRSRPEATAGGIAGHVNIPLAELPARLGELEAWRGRLIVCQCRAGEASQAAAQLLRTAGFSELANLEGGYLAWRARVTSKRNP